MFWLLLGCVDNAGVFRGIPRPGDPRGHEHQRTCRFCAGCSGGLCPCTELMFIAESSKVGSSFGFMLESQRTEACELIRAVDVLHSTAAGSFQWHFARRFAMLLPVCSSWVWVNRSTSGRRDLPLFWLLLRDCLHPCKEPLVA